MQIYKILKYASNIDYIYWVFPIDANSIGFPQSPDNNLLSKISIITITILVLLLVPGISYLYQLLRKGRRLFQSDLFLPACRDIC